MKNLSILFIAFLLLQFNTLAQAPDTLWTRTFGESGNELGNVIIETNDNGYIVGGKKNNWSYVIRLNQYGDTLWTSLSLYDGWEWVIHNLYELKPDDYIMGFTGRYAGLLRIKSNGDSVQYHMLKDIGAMNYPKLTHMSKTNDGNYILSYGDWGLGCMGVLQKADSLGNEIWEKNYSGGIAYVIQTYDGGFATIGNRVTGMCTYLGILLRKINSDGDTLWTKIVYPDTSGIRSKCLAQTTDGGYLVLANEYENIRLLRTNNVGDTLWTRTYGGSGNDICEYFAKTPDGGYIIVGSTESFGVSASDVWLIKIDSLGNIQWTKTIGGLEDDYGKYVQVTSDCGYIVTGSTRSYGQGESDVWVIKLAPDPTIPVELSSFTASTSKGKVTLTWSTATETNNNGFEVERKQDNSYWERIGFVAGHGTTTETHSYLFTDNLSDIQATALSYRLKQIDFDGSYEYSEIVLVENPAPVDYELNQNYPNPFNPVTTISYSIPIKSQVELVIYNTLGERIKKLVNEEKSVGTYEITWYAENLPSGIYFYRLQADSFVETKKMMLIK